MVPITCWNACQNSSYGNEVERQVYAPAKWKGWGTAAKADLLHQQSPPTQHPSSLPVNNSNISSIINLRKKSPMVLSQDYQSTLNIQVGN